jgi:uncharacterized protein (TIGR02996 family)
MLFAHAGDLAVALTHEGAFLADICEHPDEDAPRLVYADWLDDHGQPGRAEFIRVQCERARLPEGDDRQAGLAAREERLLLEHEGAWRAGLPALDGVTWGDFSRGFVEAAFVGSVEDFLRSAGALFAAAPVSRVRIGWLDDAWGRRLSASAHLTRLRELDLGNNPGLGRAGVQALVGSPHVVNLTSLLLHNNALGDKVAADLAGSPHLRRLRELWLSGNAFGDVGVVALARAVHLTGLAELDLRDNHFGDGGARALSYDAGRDALTTLWLTNNRIGPAGAWALAGTSHLPRLARLYLNHNHVGDDGALAFASSPHRPALRELDLRHCGIRDDGALALAGSPHLDHLELLWLGGNRVRREALGALRRRFGGRLKL